jgi:hypothetical protein
LLYLMLGVYGWFTPGCLLHTALALAIGVADNMFHLLLSMPAVVIVVLDVRMSLRVAKASGRSLRLLRRSY